MMKDNIFIYVAKNNPSGTRNLLKSEGFSKPSGFVEASYMLAQLVREDQEDGLKKIAFIHPDKNLILENNNYKNCDGYADGEGDLNADGNLKSKTGFSEQNLNLLIIGGATVISISLITLILTSK